MVDGPPAGAFQLSAVTQAPKAPKASITALPCRSDNLLGRAAVEVGQAAALAVFSGLTTLMVLSMFSIPLGAQVQACMTHGPKIHHE